MLAPRLPIGRGVRAVSIALVMAMASGLAAASPDEPGPDALRKMLADNGWVAEPAAPHEPAAAASTDAGLLRKVQDHATSMVVGAMNFIGVRYRRGGASAETGFDCSGFTQHVFEMSLGLVLPRRADEQATAPGLVAVEREDLKPGDLVFFNTLKRTFSHVGIYIGDNRFIHAPRTGKTVRTEDMSFAYWARRFTGARRVEPGTAAPAQVSAVASAPATSSH